MLRASEAGAMGKGGRRDVRAVQKVGSMGAGHRWVRLLREKTCDDAQASGWRTGKVAGLFSGSEDTRGAE